MPEIDTNCGGHVRYNVDSNDGDIGIVVNVKQDSYHVFADKKGTARPLQIHVEHLLHFSRLSPAIFHGDNTQTFPM